MAKGWLKIVTAILALAFGYGATEFWRLLRPDDPLDTFLAIGIIVAVSSFACLHFLTKGSGGD